MDVPKCLQRPVSLRIFYDSRAFNIYFIFCDRPKELQINYEINRFTCGCAGAVVRSLLTPPPNSLECALLSAVCAASLYSKCASLAASAHPSRAKYTAQKASARRTGSRGESSSSEARSARPRSADTPTTIFIVLIHVI